MKTMIPKNVNWIQNAVTELVPEENKIVTKNGDEHTYDYLVACTGVQTRFDLIPGAIEALEDPTCPAGSLYHLPYSYKMCQLREDFKGGQAIFTLPTMPIKCGGAPQKIMYLCEETWRKNGIRD